MSDLNDIFEMDPLGYTLADGAFDPRFLAMIEHYREARTKYKVGGAEKAPKKEKVDLKLDDLGDLLK